MSEAIAFFGGLICMMLVWFWTDYISHDSPFRRGYRKALIDMGKIQMLNDIIKDLEDENEEV